MRPGGWTGTLPQDLARRLKELGARNGCTFLNVLLAGFSAFIHRLTGQDDIVIGLPAAGQSIDGRDHLVGHCVNLLPLRIRLSQGAKLPGLPGPCQAGPPGRPRPPALHLWGAHAQDEHRPRRQPDPPGPGGL